MNPTTLLEILKMQAEHIDASMAEDLQTVSNKQLSEVLQYALLHGGKRVRPLLTIFSASLCHTNPDQTPDDKELTRLALVFEYLHAASLLHDDVIDRADSRRGRPAAHTVWGTTSVILAGDYLHSRAMYLAGTIGGIEILEVTSKAAQSMVASEFIQMNNAQQQDRSQAHYFAVLQGKTAALISAACVTGALYANANESQRRALQLYGNNLGLAFQIVDDLLDYLGDPAKTGKAVGNDFIEGKMTLPLLLALENCAVAEQEELLALLHNDPEARQKNVPRAREIIEKANGFAQASEQAAFLIQQASDGLGLFQECREKQVLLGLGAYVLHRDK